jgi:hypothetical protein
MERANTPVLVIGVRDGQLPQQIDHILERAFDERVLYVTERTYPDDCWLDPETGQPLDYPGAEHVDFSQVLADTRAGTLVFELPNPIDYFAALDDLPNSLVDVYVAVNSVAERSALTGLLGSLGYQLQPGRSLRKQWPIFLWTKEE